MWFRVQDPDEVRRHIPAGLRVQDEPDPVLRARYWQISHDAGLSALLSAQDLEYLRFCEAVVSVPVAHGQISGEFLAYMYADESTYISFGREVMGWPLRPGDIRITDDHQGEGPAVGDRLQGTLTRFGSVVMASSFTLTQLVPDVDRPVPKWLTQKLIPRVDAPGFAVRQLVSTGPNRVTWGKTWEAEASLSFAPSPNDELEYLRPREIVKAEYWPDVELTVGFGSVLGEL